jgi:Fe-S-cluster containining protein
VPAHDDSTPGGSKAHNEFQNALNRAPVMSGDDQPLAAGDYSTWMAELRDAMQGERAAEVPCAGCTACCTSSQFVHIGPDEADALAHIPAALLFPAPGLPRGHVLLGYDERGHCPMLVDNRCSIYEHRPRTCRTYDCRVFPAAGTEADTDKPLIAERARRWEFSFPTDEDRTARDAVLAAVAFLDQHAGLLPEGGVPANATQRAVLAIELHDLFVDRDDDPDALLAAVRERLSSRRAGNGRGR